MERMTEMIVCHRSVHSTDFSDPEARKQSSKSACSRTIKDRKAAHRRYRSLPETHAPHISARNCCKYIPLLWKKIIVKEWQDHTNFQLISWLLTFARISRISSIFSISIHWRWYSYCLYLLDSTLCSNVWQNSVLDDSGFSPSFSAPLCQLCTIFVFCCFSSFTYTASLTFIFGKLTVLESRLSSSNPLFILPKIGGCGWRLMLLFTFFFMLKPTAPVVYSLQVFLLWSDTAE